MRTLLHGSVGFAGLLLTLSANTHAADLKLASVFGDHMVLQRDVPLCIWGTATPAGKVSVRLGEQSAEATANANGTWRAELKPQTVGGPLELSIASGADSVVLRDILLGDVWLCAGQSNMQFSLGEAVGNEPVLKQLADDASVRLLMIPKAPAEEPSNTFDAKWTVKDAKSTSNFTAVGAFFAAALRKHDPELQNVPIGLVDSSFGGTRVEGWIESSKLAPFDPKDLHESMFGIKPSQLYNAMIAPLAGVRFKGVLWYQGESNTAQAALYPDLLRTMIGQWRSDFADPTLPFYLVQLANYPNPWESYSFAWLRDAQAKVAKDDEHVHLAVAIDTPDGFDLHPKHKAPLGDRLARLAAKHSYGKPVVAQGPVFSSAKADGNAIIVTFDVGESALEIKGDGTSGFDLAGEDGVFYAARATRVDDRTLRVAAKEVKQPTFVRYAFRADPAATLFNREGLPAAPFRTDNQPQTPMVEVQAMRPSRRIVTERYSARIEADGRLSSVMVNGEELLSTDDGGGFLALGAWGARSLDRVEALRPDRVRFSDRGVAITYTFSQEEIDITLDNQTDAPLSTRFLLNPLAEPDGAAQQGRATFGRTRSRLTLEGGDAPEKLFGLIHQVKADVKAKSTGKVTVRLSAK